MSNHVDIFAGLFELLGIYLVGNKKWYAFIFLIICGILWLYVGWERNLYGLWIAIIPAIVINTRNLFKWYKESKNEN